MEVTPTITRPATSARLSTRRWPVAVSGTCAAVHEPAVRLVAASGNGRMAGIRGSGAAASSGFGPRSLSAAYAKEVTQPFDAAGWPGGLEDHAGQRSRTYLRRLEPVSSCVAFDALM